MDGVSTVEDAIEILMKGVPIFPEMFPPLVWKHQLYAFPGLGSKTSVDQQINNLLSDGKIRCLKIGSMFANSTVVLFRSSFEEYVKEKNLGRLEDKLMNLVKTVTGHIYSASDMTDFSQDEIKTLIQRGFLAVDREVGKWVLSLPSAAVFIRTHSSGRKVLMRTIRSTKFREMMAVELQQRKLPSSCKFDFKYFLTDLIGSGDVECRSTPAGLLLRLL